HPCFWTRFNCHGSDISNLEKINYVLTYCIKFTNLSLVKEEVSLGQASESQYIKKCAITYHQNHDPDHLLLTH
ncbi:MAG: hypothetical protein ACKPEQ_43175, partial [Dolichospermum sp.]